MTLWVKMHVRFGERGASLVEYALLVALIALVVVVALQIVSDELNRDMRRVGRALER
jgi:Flp pilus assembly pilin Flp